MARPASNRAQDVQNDVEQQSILNKPAPASEDAALHKPKVSSAVAAGACYCVVSASMILLNKYALSGFSFTCPNTLLLAQCVASVAIVKAGEAAGCWHVEPLRWDIIKIWLPANVIFILMLATGVWALQLVGVAMVTVLKNLTNLLTITGDYFIYGRTYNAWVWASLALIAVSAAVGAHTDRAFTWRGYGAQLLNCALAAGYSLALRGIMDKVTATLGRKMETHNEVYLNNMLSIPCVCGLIFAFGEHTRIQVDPALRSPLFLAVAAASCAIGFAISYASLWFLSASTPTTYSLVGSLNKIPVAIVGILAFRAPTSAANVGSIAVGLVAGVVFVRAKQQ